MGRGGQYLEERTRKGARRFAPCTFTGGAATSTTKVFLAAAHLDHDPGNNRFGNLKAFCQRCHMLHDRAEHLRRRRLAFRMRKAIGDLFLGTYSQFG